MSKDRKHFQEAESITNRLLKVSRSIDKKINLEKIAKIYLFSIHDLFEKRGIIFLKKKKIADIKIIKKFLSKFTIGLTTCLITL